MKIIMYIILFVASVAGYAQPVLYETQWGEAKQPVFRMEKFLLNGSIDLKRIKTKSQFINALGKPDKIRTASDTEKDLCGLDDMEQPAYFYDYGKTTFSILEDGTVHLTDLDVSSGRFYLQTADKKITINKTTHWDQLRKFYPDGDLRKKSRGYIVSAAPCAQCDGDLYWLLFNKNKKLLKIQWIANC